MYSGQNGYPSWPRSLKNPVTITGRLQTPGKSSYVLFAKMLPFEFVLQYCEAFINNYVRILLSFARESPFRSLWICKFLDAAILPQTVTMDQMPAPVPNAPLSGAASHIDKVGLVIIVWVCFSAATLFVTFRLTVRWRQNRYFLPDDYWIIFAWLCALTMAILQTIQMEALWFITYLTAGRISSADPTMAHNLTELTRWQFPVIKLFWTILWSVKASFLAAFYRLVKPIRWARNMWYGVAVFAFLAYVGCWISSTLTCTPVGDYFIPGIHS